MINMFKKLKVKQPTLTQQRVCKKNPLIQLLSGYEKKAYSFKSRTKQVYQLSLRFFNMRLEGLDKNKKIKKNKEMKTQ